MQADLFSQTTTADQKFNQFNHDNPSVYRSLVKLAREARSMGKRKISIELLINRVRWDIWMATTDTDFKINNNYKSRYARLIMQNEYDLRDIFNTRELRS